MTETCVACGYKFKHEYEYHNEEAGILLCQKCSFKVAKHYIDGWEADYTMRARLASNAKEFMSILEKIDGRKGDESKRKD